MILPHFHIGGVDPDIGPFTHDGALQESVHPLVDLLAEPLGGSLVDPRRRAPPNADANKPLAPQTV